MKRGTIALILAACLGIAACTTVATTQEGATVRTFGAATTIVDADGSITTESPGLSEGLTTTVVRVVASARDAFLAFFGREPVGDRTE